MNSASNSNSTPTSTSPQTSSQTTPRTPTPRTIALVGGTGSGKTTLAEALLHRAGAISRAGDVEQGTTVCDHEPEEIARRHDPLALARLPRLEPDGGDDAP